MGDREMTWKEYEELLEVKIRVKILHELYSEEDFLTKKTIFTVLGVKEDTE